MLTHLLLLSRKRLMPFLPRFLLLTFHLSLLTILLVRPAFSQQTWTRTYGGSNFDLGSSVQQTSDGGFIIAGRTRSFGAGLTDVYLIKTNASGNTLWTRTYGDTNGDGGYSVQQTSDGGYIVAGYTYSYGHANDFTDVYLVKTDASGDTLWTRTYGGIDNDVGFSVQQTSDGGYIIAGMTSSFGNGDQVYLVKTNATGDTLWTRTYGGAKFDCGSAVHQTSDGGYIIVGGTCSFGDSLGEDVYLIKTNASGNPLWTRTYGGATYDGGSSVQQTTDGGYIIAGITGSSRAGGMDVYLIKTNAAGVTLWTKTFGGMRDDYGRSVRQTTDGGYIIAGYTTSFGAGREDVYLIKTNSSGDTLWTRTYGGTDGDEGNSVQQTSDGGYIIAGWTMSFGASSYDVYLIKTDKNGIVKVR